MHDIGLIVETNTIDWQQVFIVQKPMTVIYFVNFILPQSLSFLENFFNYIALHSLELDNSAQHLIVDLFFFI